MLGIVLFCSLWQGHVCTGRDTACVHVQKQNAIKTTSADDNWVIFIKQVLWLTGDDYSVQVNLSDYLDILCPHYPADHPSSSPVEALALYLVAESQFKGCVETKEAIKRWECNQPFAPYGPVRFSEKIQRFTPFSLGFEFLPGSHYYYSSLSTDDGPPLPCMKLRVTVCCPPSKYSPLFTL
ncbi:hypothetical protein cypCar_00013196 [Cyprinus carpio]|nr:hypothetical protein cypCar_00013196 [Cyprinus carpio]